MKLSSAASAYGKKLTGNVEVERLPYHDVGLECFYKQACVEADTPLVFQVALAAVRKKYPNPLD
jgi:hypothetical protein